MCINTENIMMGQRGGSVGKQNCNYHQTWQPNFNPEDPHGEGESINFQRTLWHMQINKYNS